MYAYNIENKKNYEMMVIYSNRNTNICNRTI